jgi:hypothetical protein
MSLQTRLVVAGLSAIQAQAIQGTVANNVAAAGASQATAAPLQADLNNVTVVGAGSGVIMPAMNPGDEIVVHNGQAVNALLLYPPVGAAINALGANAGYSIAVATPLCYIECVTPTLYLCSQAA